MKKIVTTLICWLAAAPLFAQTVIHTKDGRTFNVPVNASEIARIEFTPVTTVVPNPFLGKWARKDGGTIVEYMEIVQGEQQIEFLFRGTANGPVTSKSGGQLQNGVLSGKGSNRNMSMRMNKQNGIDYTSTDFDGKKPWSCTWVRVN